MFDGLKDKISGFKEEVDEEVEAEEVDVDEEDIEEEIEQEIEEYFEVDEDFEEELEEEIHEEVEAVKEKGVSTTEIDEGSDAQEDRVDPVTEEEDIPEHVEETEKTAVGAEETEKTAEGPGEQTEDPEKTDETTEGPGDPAKVTGEEVIGSGEETQEKDKGSEETEQEGVEDEDGDSGSGRFGGLKKKASGIVSRSGKESEDKEEDVEEELEEAEDDGEAVSDPAVEDPSAVEPGKDETAEVSGETEETPDSEDASDTDGDDATEDIDTDVQEGEEDGEDGLSTRRGRIASKAKGVVSRRGKKTEEGSEKELEDDEEIEEEIDNPEEVDEVTRRRRIAKRAKTLMGDRAFVIDEDSLEKPLRDLEMALLSNDVNMDVAQDILDTMKEDLVGEKKHWRESKDEIIMDALRDALLEVLTVDGFTLKGYLEENEKPVVIIFTGVNGVGKTTTIAKLSRFLEKDGFSTVWANGDTYRAGANEQIEEHAKNLDKKLITHEKGGDPAAVIYDAVEYAEANDVDVVLGDTAGRLHTSQGLMDQLEKIDRVVDPDLNIFVDESVAGQDAVNRAEEFKETADTDAVILTKADADSNGGAAISVSRVTGEPILFLGVGQGYDDLERFEPEKIVDELVGEEGPETVEA
ncbi:MAG: signal recognition particle-docking protein FtsY [Halobacteria archaeon]